MTDTLTSGVHHLGLTVPNLETAELFFTETLGWFVKGRKPDYPAVFVSDGVITLTLWRVRDPEQFIPFDRKNNIGLHHLALVVADYQALLDVFNKVRAHEGVVIEFEPQKMSPDSPRHHFMCLIPGGVRVEFAMKVI